jgi:hypothetical protein
MPEPKAHECPELVGIVPAAGKLRVEQRPDIRFAKQPRSGKFPRKKNLRRPVPERPVDHSAYGGVQEALDEQGAGGCTGVIAGLQTHAALL